MTAIKLDTSHLDYFFAFRGSTCIAYDISCAMQRNTPWRKNTNPCKNPEVNSYVITVLKKVSPGVNMCLHTDTISDRCNFNLRKVFIILELHNNYVILTDKHCQQTLA